jgi:hypothetical protein
MVITETACDCKGISHELDFALAALQLQPRFRPGVVTRRLAHVLKSEPFEEKMPVAELERHL